MNDEPLMIEIPVVIKNGKVEFLHGELPRLKEKTIGNLFIPDYGFQNPKDVERFLLIETIVILAAGTTLHAPMKDIGDKEIILDEPLRLTFRGTKKPALEDCRCALPSLKSTARSVNEAYTRLSEKYEPHRRGHGGNVFQKVFYLPPGQHQWQPLDELRLVKQNEFQKKLFSRTPEASNLVAGAAKSPRKPDEPASPTGVLAGPAIAFARHLRGLPQASPTMVTELTNAITALERLPHLPEHTAAFFSGCVSPGNSSAVGGFFVFISPTSFEVGHHFSSNSNTNTFAPAYYLRADEDGDLPEERLDWEELLSWIDGLEQFLRKTPPNELIIRVVDGSLATALTQTPLPKAPMP